MVVDVEAGNAATRRPEVLLDVPAFPVVGGTVEVEDPPELAAGSAITLDPLT